MKSISIKLATALLLVAALALGAQKQDQVERQLKAAMNTELVDGNLKAAIEQYKKVVDSGFRPLAAQALIHMAECYQKLGNADSQKVYQRIVLEYADQKDALALAQARLGGTAFGSMKGDRVVWSGFDVGSPFGGLDSVSADGRFITFTDRNSAALMIHDIAANVDRMLVPPSQPIGARFVDDSLISRDGRQVVYRTGESERFAFHIASLQGDGFHDDREFFHFSYDDIYQSLGAWDWSPDGKWIVQSFRRKDRTVQIGLIGVTDGSFRVLKSIMDWNNSPNRISFSVDSKTIAYDLPATDGTDKRDLFVMAIEASRESTAVAHDAKSVIGWSPDGARLLFSSDRLGSVDLWAFPFADGKVQGPSELLKSDIGASVPLGRLTASGALYVSKRINSRDTVIAPIDLNAGKLLGPPVSFSEGFVNGAEGPGLWSPDGNSLAYSAPCHDRQCVAIRTVATGKVSLLSGIAKVFGPRWSPDGHLLLTRGVDEQKRNGWFQFDVQTGVVTPLTFFQNGERGEQLRWSPDGKLKVYFNRSGVFIERDVASGAEREFNRVPGLVGVGPISPDGQFFSPNLKDPTTKTDRLLIVPVAGGQPRELLRLMQPEEFGGCCVWTPDSKAVMFVKNTGSRKELWLIPVTGGPPRKLDIDPALWIEGSVGDQGISLSPDGRRIAFQMGKTVNEVWALENFLPAPRAKK